MNFIISKRKEEERLVEIFSTFVKRILFEGIDENGVSTREFLEAQGYDTKYPGIPYEDYVENLRNLSKEKFMKYLEEEEFKNMCKIAGIEKKIGSLPEIIEKLFTFEEGEEFIVCRGVEKTQEYFEKTIGKEEMDKQINKASLCFRESDFFRNHLPKKVL